MNRFDRWIQTIYLKCFIVLIVRKINWIFIWLKFSVCYSWTIKEILHLQIGKSNFPFFIFKFKRPVTKLFSAISICVLFKTVQCVITETLKAGFKPLRMALYDKTLDEFSVSRVIRITKTEKCESYTVSCPISMIKICYWSRFE